jgi:hypothetical protein
MASLLSYYVFVYAVSSVSSLLNFSTRTGAAEATGTLIGVTGKPTLRCPSPPSVFVAVT